MFKIDPDALYTRDDLARELGDVMTVRTFLRRLKGRLRHQFKGVYFGQDLIDALCAPAPEKKRRALPSIHPTPRSRSPKARENPHHID